MQVLVSQFLDAEPGAVASKPEPALEVSEEKATLLYMIDLWNKHLFDFKDHPVRKTRETLDEFAREIVTHDGEKLAKVLFRFRQYWSSYRIDEYAYLHKTFDDFRGIIWDFVDQLAEDLAAEKSADSQMVTSLENLREAVESNSIHSLKTQSRAFIDNYMEFQSKKSQRRDRRLQTIKKNLDVVKKELTEANAGMRQDHLTKAFNRKSFDEQIRNVKNLCDMFDKKASLLMIDIDHFKAINDRFGHANGDVVLIECVKWLKEVFNREVDFVARVGGEEFAILLTDYDEESAVKKAEQAHERIRNEALVKDDMTIKFTISIGAAQLKPHESIDDWMKRADAALYFSKNNGRNRTTASSTLRPRRETA